MLTGTIAFAPEASQKTPKFEKKGSPKKVLFG
jgi:hypothetical protein